MVLIKGGYLQENARKNKEMVLFFFQEVDVPKEVKLGKMRRTGHVAQSGTKCCWSRKYTEPDDSWEEPNFISLI